MERRELGSWALLPRGGNLGAAHTEHAPLTSVTPHGRTCRTAGRQHGLLTVWPQDGRQTFKRSRGSQVTGPTCRTVPRALLELTGMSVNLSVLC